MTYWSRWTRVSGVALLFAMMTSLLMHGAAAPQEPRKKAAQVALTFDDLPAHGPVPPGSSRVDIAQRIIATLRSHRTPPIYGFVNAKDLDEHPEDAEVLRLWHEAGFPLGNHGFSHMDLHANTVEAFEQDLLANEATLRRYMDNQDWTWFRFPYLHEGDTPEKHRAVRNFISGHYYRIAEVTLSFDDYAYNEPYARCLAKQDTAGIEWLKESYLTRADESLRRGQEAAQTLFQHDIPHVMLLHIGGFETVMLPRLLDLLRERGFELVTLTEGHHDLAYATDPALRANWSGTLLEQLLRARRPPPSTSAAPVSPPAPGGIFEKLGSLCR
jgi:peptidoglycan/xylan/chitin deacetylase (PgdA/CDA1 family)